MSSSPAAATPAPDARTSAVIADALAVHRDGASFADAAADLFSSECERAEGRLADMLASPAPDTAPGAAAASGTTSVAGADSASVTPGAVGPVRP